MRMYKIMIVEDDPVIANALKQHLEFWSYQVLCVSDFKGVMGDFAAFEPQLVFMDIVLPFFNGYHWCQEIRKISQVPVVFISSAADNMNIVMAMTMGGDDFIAKPFDLTVVTAKLQAILRRIYERGAPVHTLGRGGVLLNLNDTTMSCGEASIGLTKNEFKILQILMNNGGQIVSREAMMNQLWEDEHFIDDNTLTVNVNRLRKKLEEVGAVNYIITKKGLGYMVM